MRSNLVFSSLAAITLAFTAPAFAQQQMPQAQTPASGQMTTGQMTAQGQVQKHKLSEKGQKFAKEAAITSMAEIELGKLAQQNAQSDEVKQFGDRMVQDHTTANQQLTPILTAADMTMPTQLDEKHKKMYDKLSKMRGAEFDRTYMRDMVQGHEKAVKDFRQEATHGSDADLKSFAQNTLPVLEQHLKTAHEISKSLTAVGSSSREGQSRKGH